MRKLILLPVLALIIAIPGDTSGFPRGGGGGGARGGGGGGARPGGGGGGISRPSAPARTPSFSPSRPSAPQRPSAPVQRPSQGIQRPSQPIQRPSQPSKPAFVPKPSNPIANRPSIGGGGAGIQNRPGIGGGGIGDRPGIGGGGIQNRPGIGGGGIGDRPGIGGGGIGDRPGIGGGGIQNRPGIGGGGIGDRPGIGGGGIGDRPGIGGGGIGNRPGIGGGGIGDRPGIGGGGINNRPNIGIGNRPNIGDRPNIGNIGDRNNFIGNDVNINRPIDINNQINRGMLVNRPNGGLYRPGYAYYSGYHNGWHHGYCGGGWYNRPWYWGGAALATGLTLGAVNDVVYSNPYYVEPSEPTYVPVYDYSQPIQVPQPVVVEQVAPLDATAPAAVPPSEPVDEKAQAASKLLDEARETFKKGDYAAAQATVEKAIKILPNDATLHEFRALTLFAQKKYAEASATIYAVLAVGPGWDWETLKTLYPDPATYTAQLRALEDYCKVNTKDAGARFLLAYHYLVLDSKDAAIKMFKSVVELQPKDELAAYLLKMLQQPATGDRPAPM